MKYSELDSYVKYMDAKVRGDFVRAELMLQQCLDNADVQRSPCHLADLWQRMGEVRYMKGDTEGALVCMDQAESADPTSLLVKYFVAEFLGLRLGDKAAAIEKCDSIIASTLSQPFAETEEDFGSEAYRRKAEQLKEKLS